MNDMMQESQRIATQMQNMIPKDTYKNMQSALANICIPKVQMNTALIEYTKSFQQIMPPAIVTNIMSDTMNTILASVQEKLNELHKTISSCIQNMTQALQFSFSDRYREVYDRMLLLKIAEEIGYPVYLECDTELQDILIEIYRENNNRCNKEKMRQVVMEYCNEDYIDCICNGLITTNTFNKRVRLLKEGIIVYQLGHYGAANALFMTQISGMILDIYNQLSYIHKYTRAEKNEIKKVFALGNCKDNSEKVMLAEIISEQEGGILVWHQKNERGFKAGYYYKHSLIGII